MYALCTKCGHGDSYWKGGKEGFTVFNPKIDISSMTPSEMAAEGAYEDLEVECPKCGSDEVQIMDHPPAGKRESPKQ